MVQQLPLVSSIIHAATAGYLFEEKDHLHSHFFWQCVDGMETFYHTLWVHTDFMSGILIKSSEVLLCPYNYCNTEPNLFDENTLRDDGRRVDNTKMHSALVNTCFQLFQNTKTLRLVSQSSGRPDLISFLSLPGHSNLFLPTPNHNYTSFPRHSIAEQ